ncbi:hypothetical protein LWI29_004859 [Acer saccharum]|uniref:Retrotransposon Copia-like N-terminal domain-containing protein n=1 Tax=Acer saccharum TaxID=4024 RepID=A0AA39STE3_ACESA|nr:hypothetical protein LWI29_004859 [Acer saccharum]
MANGEEGTTSSTNDTPTAPAPAPSEKNAAPLESRVRESRTTSHSELKGQSRSKNQTNPGNALGSFCSVKLNHENYLLWKSMVLLVIRGNRLEGFIIGTKTCPPEFLSSAIENSTDVEVHLNPDYEYWVTQDQNLLGWLYNSIDVEVASEVIGNETSKDLWDALKTLFGVQTRSNVVFFKKECKRMQKGGLKMGEYLKTMKKLADNWPWQDNPLTQTT